jgi:hypothetical protein
MKNYETYTNQNKNENIIFKDFIFTKEARSFRSNEFRCANRKCSCVGSIVGDFLF